ncbi:DUF1549 domain-containing protein [Paraliomyxa miuraensis]|uniref:DUF1549 domain-containing protein n=1 Tax=Paraliomyxa miuraensis TaxID=376150 RepID=UPI00225892F6|nr:DUF1549 domain-containing protein [Paraliomyxa miuraensis]MCX4244519.1 DUF1549 and DUF1553 domain-containing protein [Paraliomyxa miuraensis]
MTTKPWVKDVLFVGLGLCGLASLLWAFGPIPGLRAAPLAAVPRPTSEQAEIEAVASGVDDDLRALQAAAGVEPVPRADGLTLARRLSLALTGTIPSLEEIRALEAQPPERALAWWVDHVLADRRHADYLAERLARSLVGVEQGSLIVYRRRRFVAWLSDQLAHNRPWDRIATQMIADQGLWTQNPQTNFVTAAIKPGASVPQEEVLAGRVSRAFLGVRLDCAQCHDHPFDPRWTQADFQGIAAFFGRSKATIEGVAEIRGPYHYDAPGVDEPVPIEPSVPLWPELLPPQGGDRQRLAAWVTHPSNRAFSRAIVNRMWNLMLGRPLVEPVDDLPVDGEVPAALDRLADDFVAHGFDLRRLCRVIAATEAFGRESRAPSAEDDEPRLEARLSTWAEFPLTRLRPEQMVGALLQSASLSTVDHESHVVIKLARFVQEREFVRRYGDAGEDELEPDAGTIPQRLLMLNGDLVHRRTRDDLVGNAATRIAMLTDDDARAIEVAYLAVLTRRPSPVEAEHFGRRLSGLRGKARREALTDLYWTLHNSTEAAWNH